MILGECLRKKDEEGKVKFGLDKGDNIEKIEKINGWCMTNQYTGGRAITVRCT